MSDRGVRRETVSEWRARVIPDLCAFVGVVLCVLGVFAFAMSPVEDEADGVYTSMSDKDYGVFHVCEFEYEFRIGSLRYASYYSGDGKEVRLSECPSSYLIAGREVKERMTVRYEVDDPDSSHAKTGWSLPTARTNAIALSSIGVVLIVSGIVFPLPSSRVRREAEAVEVEE